MGVEWLGLWAAFRGLVWCIYVLFSSPKKTLKRLPKLRDNCEETLLFMAKERVKIRHCVRDGRCILLHVTAFFLHQDIKTLSCKLDEFSVNNHICVYANSKWDLTRNASKIFHVLHATCNSLVLSIHGDVRANMINSGEP